MQKLILSIRDVDDEMGTEMPSKTQAEYEDDLITNLEVGVCSPNLQQAEKNKFKRFK